MKLIDLLSKTIDETHIRVFDYLTEQLLTEADGKNSIDPYYNDEEIESIDISIEKNHPVMNVYLESEIPFC